MPKETELDIDLLVKAKQMGFRIFCYGQWADPERVDWQEHWYFLTPDQVRSVCFVDLSELQEALRRYIEK